MNIKALTNNKDIYEPFLEELDTWITKEQKNLEHAETLESVYRSQGYIKALRKLKTLKEIVNTKGYQQHG